jgi:uncharacterized protein (TIGR02145 family)
MKQFLLFIGTIFFISISTMGQWTCGDTLTDIRDGKKYPTVMIGNRCWMASSLNIGIQITGSTQPQQNSVIEKYCYNDDPANCVTHGGLYSWNEMMNYVTTEKARGICPAGWHIPSDVELKELEMFLGMDSATANLSNVWRGTDQGEQVLAGGTSGFNILFSGLRASTGDFMAIGQFAYIYSSTESGNNAWRRCLRDNDARVGRFNTFLKEYSFSVRCVRDTNDTTTSILQLPIETPQMFYVSDNNTLHFKDLNTNQCPFSLMIFDMTGKKLYSTTVHEAHTALLLPALSEGLYIFHVSGKSINISQKIFIPKY